MALLQSILLILVSAMMGMGVEGKEDALASITTEDPPLLSLLEMGLCLACCHASLSGTLYLSAELNS